MSRKPSDLDRLIAAMDRCAVARGEAQWTNGYRTAARPAEQDRLHPKEIQQWKAVEQAEKNFRKLASSLLRRARGASLTEQNAALEQANREWRKELHGAALELRSADQLEDDHKAIIAEATANVERLSSEVASLTDDTLMRTGQLQESRAKVARLMEQNAALELLNGRKFVQIESLESAVASLRADRDRLLRFAGLAINETRGMLIGNDWDGGDVESALLDCGLLEPHRATEACGDGCNCDEFPLVCFRPTDLGRAAIDAMQRATPSPPETTAIPCP